MHLRVRIMALMAGLGLAMALATMLGAVVRLASPVYADPVTRYVAKAGDDSGGNDCSSLASPCKTIQRAVDVATGGDEIRVAVGVYSDLNAYGGLSQVVHVTRSVTIRGGFLASDWAIYDPAANATQIDAQNAGWGYS